MKPIYANTFITDKVHLPSRDERCKTQIVPKASGCYEGHAGSDAHKTHGRRLSKLSFLQSNCKKKKKRKTQKFN